MVKDERLTQEDLLKIRSELSEELKKMTPPQRKEYLEAATNVYHALSKMAKIRKLVEA